MVGLLILFPLVVLTLPGVVLLIRGLRGELVNHHPTCRQCRFDLFGNPQAASCPECGAQLKHPRAIRMGVRQKRRGMIIAAVLLLLPVIGGGGTFGYFASRDFDWRKIKPVWWLTVEANRPPGPVSDAALDELVRRLNNGALSGGQVQAIIDNALAHQADANRTWQTQWGDIVEQTHTNGKLSDEDWRTYANNILDSYAQLILRPQVRLGDPIPFRIQDLPARVGGGTHFWGSESGASMVINGLAIEHHLGGGGAINASAGGSTGGSVKLKPEQLKQFQPGSAEVELILNVAIKQYLNGRPNDEPILEKQVHLKAATQFVPADQPTATIMSEAGMTDELDATVRAAIKLKSLSHRQREWHRKQGKTGLSTKFAITTPSADIAFAVYARLDGVEKKLSSITIPAGNTTDYHTGGAVPDTWEGEQVDIILRPSLDAAVNSVDCFKIWGGEIVFENMKIEPRE